MAELKSYAKIFKASPIRIRDGVFFNVLSSLVNSLEEIYNLEIRPDDVWIVTYPKCGKTYSIIFLNI